MEVGETCKITATPNSRRLRHVFAMFIKALSDTSVRDNHSALNHQLLRPRLKKGRFCAVGTDGTIMSSTRNKPKQACPEEVLVQI